MSLYGKDALETKLDSLLENLLKQELARLTDASLSAPISPSGQRQREEWMNEAMNIKKRLSDLLESVPTSTKQHPLKTPERKVKSKPKETRVDPVLMQAMMMQTSLPEDTTDDRSFKPIDGVTEDSDFTHLFPTESAQPQFTPTFFRYTVSELKGVFKALGLQVSESQSRFIFEYLGHLDVAFLFFLSLVWSVLLPWAPRLEWMALVTVSGRSFWRAWNESHEFFFIFVALMMTLSGMTIAVQVKLSSGLSSLMIPFLASVLLHWSTISYYRKRDPTAQSQWFTFIILDLLLKPLNGSMVEVTVSSYCLVYGVFVLLTTVAAVSKEQWNQNEAAGVPGYNVNGKMVQPWNWDAVHGTIVETFKAGSTTETAPSSSTDKTRPCSYFSNHWNKSDRFELVAECISEETATLAYLIPSSLATTFCLDDETLAGARKSEFAMHNINAHVDQSPPHYISLDQFKVFVNGHLWKEFTLDSSLGVFVVNGLIAGKSYKIVVGVKGYLSVPIRIVMSHGADKKVKEFQKVSGSSSTSQQPALSRPLSAMSWMDKDVSFFSSHESGGEDVDYFQTGEGLSLSGSSSSLLNLASSSGETTTKPELESHLSNTLKKQMSLKKTLESRIHSLQRTHKKTLSTLKKNIEAMKKLTFKAGGQEDKYQAKIGVYKSAIKGLLEGIPSLKGQLSQVSKELTRVQSEVGQKESELSRSREDYTRLQEELKALVSMQELELQNALLKKSSRSEESVEITHCKARYNRLVSEIESLNSVDSPKSIPGLTRKLEATHGHYQKWIEWNVQDKSLALNCLERQKEIQLWKDAVDKARETHVLLSETLTREIEFTERLQDELARCA